jgi:hypothetical protein
VKKIKNIIAATVAIAVLATAVDVNAQWRRRAEPLPGMVSGQQIATFAIIAGGSLLLAIMIPRGRPEFHIKRSDLINRDKTPAENRSEAVAKIERFSGPSVVYQKKGGKCYGVVVPDHEDEFSVQTESGNADVQYTNVKEIMDLKSAAKRKQMGSVKWGLFYMGMAVAWFYSASWDTGLGDDSSTINTGLGVASMALGIIMIVNQSDEAKEYRKWLRSQETDSEALINSDYDISDVAMRLGYCTAPTLNIEPPESEKKSVWVVFDWTL